MPAPIHTIVISPVDKLDELLSITGYTPTSALYTISDTAPRSISYKARSGANTVAQREMLDLATVAGEIVATNIDPSLDGCVFKDWPRDQPSPYSALLSNLGLTSDPNA